MSEFNREERYIVIKRKHLDEAAESALRGVISGLDLPTIECVVVESDWPNYEHVWQTVERVAKGEWPKRDNHERLVEALWHAMQCWEYDGVSDEHGAVAKHCGDLLASLEAEKGGE